VRLAALAQNVIHSQETIMKRFVVIACLLVSACSTVQAPPDPFAHLCPAQSNESCPGDVESPIILSGTTSSELAATVIIVE
jgi:hypothetical protein